jgi:hypothetical protein
MTIIGLDRSSGPIRKLLEEANADISDGFPSLFIDQVNQELTISGPGVEPSALVLSALIAESKDYSRQDL